MVFGTRENPGYSSLPYLSTTVIFDLKTAISKDHQHVIQHYVIQNHVIQDCIISGVPVELVLLSADSFSSALQALSSKGDEGGREDFVSQG